MDGNWKATGEQLHVVCLRLFVPNFSKHFYRQYIVGFPQASVTFLFVPADTN
jgi:hypothetical protein